MNAPKVVTDLPRRAIYVYTRYEDRELIRTIPGTTWRASLKAWSVPISPDNIERMQRFFPGVEIPLEVIEAIEAERLAMTAVEEAKDAGWESAEPVAPMPIKTTPFQHQVLGYNVAMMLPASALLMEQGTGKTLTAIAAINRRFVEGDVNRVLIIAPMSVLPVWRREFIEHTDLSINLDVRVLDGLSAKRAEILAKWPGKPDTLSVAVTNYEGAWRIIDQLIDWKPDAVVCDESQRIKTPGAQQSKALHTLGRHTRYRMILTGTPVTQSPLDFFSQYKFLDPKIFGNSFGAFKARYAVFGGYQRHEVVGYRDLDDLTKKAHSIAFRVTKEQALDLPPQLDQSMYATLVSREFRDYDSLLKRSIVELEEAGRTMTATTAIAQLLRLTQFTGGFLSDDGNQHVWNVSTAKMKLFREVIQDMMAVEGRKVVVFARFLPELRAIRDILTSEGITHTYIQGEVPQEERGTRVERFQTDPECRVFVAQIATAGLGITLHAADTAIFYSLSFSFAEYDQCRARIHRIGQKFACTYIHLLVKDSVDERVLSVLQQKRDVASVVVDNWRELLGGPVTIIRGAKKGGAVIESRGVPRRISTMRDDQDADEAFVYTNGPPDIMKKYKEASARLLELTEADHGQSGV